MSANSHFFSHDFNARNNYKLLELRAEFGWEGYGVFWALCEIISENDKPLPLDRLGAVSVALGVPKEYLAGFIKICIDLDIFIETEAGVTSESLESRLEHKREVIRKRSEAGKKSAEARKKKQGVEQEVNKSSTSVEHLSSKRNETKRNETKEKEGVDKSTSPKSKKKKAPKNSPEEKLKAFKNEVREVGGDIYNSDTLQAFYDYWTEPSQKKKGLFNWETQDTWGTSRRLATWAKRSLGYNESPYKAQVKKVEKEDPKIKELESITNFLLDPPEHITDLGPAEAE